MSGFDVSLSGVNTFLGNSSGRDKLGKLVHYGARGVAGIAADYKDSLPKGSEGQVFAENVHAKARSLFVRIMNARRTTRWLSSTGILLALQKPCPWDNRPAWLVAQYGMVWWQLTDHIRWLQQIKWLPGDEARTKRIGFTGFFISAIVSFLYHLKQFLTVEETEKKKKARKLQIVKHFVTVLAAGHISEIAMSHEAICGFGGAIAASIDIYEMFPRKEKEK
mmetsp:Transcript_17467/g.21069  ORF Transcript_17467/g.21069 Transcript_17467/m.21069 type:complete len:221 (+) Transcript_17467:95-757(+)